MDNLDCQANKATGSGVCVLSLHVFYGVRNPFPCHPICADDAVGGGDSSVVRVLDS